MLDILLWPFVVGTPKGSVAASHGCISGHGRPSLAGRTLGTCMAGQLGWKYFLSFSCFSHFWAKNGIFVVESIIIFVFFDFFLMSHDFMCFFDLNHP